VQREEVARIRVVEGTPPKASGVQRRGGQRRARHVPSRDWRPINQTSDVGHPQRDFSAGWQNDVPAHRHERAPVLRRWAAPRCQIDPICVFHLISVVRLAAVQ